jgi:hypothetical protein
VALPIAVLAAIGVARGQEKAPALVNAWVRAPDAGATSATAFATVDNPGMYELWIVSAASDASASVELREGDGSKSRVAKEINVPAYGKLDMTESGPRLILVGLTRPLKAGDRVALSLKTDGGATLKAEAVVK